MNTREFNHIREEREQKVAMCIRTFFNMNGKQPEVREMVSWLGEDYLLDIMRFRRSELQMNAVCA